MLASVNFYVLNDCFMRVETCDDGFMTFHTMASRGKDWILSQISDKYIFKLYKIQPQAHQNVLFFLSGQKRSFDKEGGETDEEDDNWEEILTQAETQTERNRETTLEVLDELELMARALVTTLFYFTKNLQRFYLHLFFHRISQKNINFSDTA